MERCHVGKTHEKLWMFFNHGIIEKREKTGRAIAAPEADDGFHGVVFEEVIDICSSLFVAPREIAVIGSNRGGQFHFVSHFFQEMDGLVIICHSAVRPGRNDTNRVTRPQCGRFLTRDSCVPCRREVGSDSRNDGRVKRRQRQYHQSRRCRYIFSVFL